MKQLVVFVCAPLVPPHHRRRLRRWLLSTALPTVLLLCSCATAPALNRAKVSQERPIAIVGATLIDGSGSASRPDVNVIIRGDRISQVGAEGAARQCRDHRANLP